MALDLAAILDALKTRLVTANPNLTVYARQPDSIAVPCAVVGLPVPPIEYHDAFRQWQMDIPVRVYVNRADLAEAITALAPYISTTGTASIYAAVEGDTTLGGTVGDTMVVEGRGFGAYDVGGIMYLGGEWLLRLIGDN